jgi:hypothetical protein
MAEWRRILCRRSILIAVALLLVINGVLFLQHINLDLFQGIGDVKESVKQRRQVYAREAELLSQYEEQEPEAALEEIRTILDAAMEKWLEGGGATTGFDAGETANSLLEQQYEYILEYPTRMEEIAQNAKLMAEGSAGSGNSTFAIRNIEKTAEDYENISDATLTPGYNEAVESLVTYSQSEYLTFLFLLILLLFFMEERKKGLWNFIYVTPKGRKRMAARRTGIMVGSACLMTALLWAENLLLAVISYGGLGSLSRSIQSVPEFSSVTINISIGMYLFLMVLGKMLTLAALGLFVWVLTAYVRMAVFGIGIAVLFIGAEYAAWTWIARSHPLAFLKYINLFAYIDMGTTMKNYVNLNLLGYPVEIFTVFWIVTALILVVLVVAAVCSGNVRPTSGSSRLRNGMARIRGKLPRLFHKPVPVCHETYKQLWVQGGIFVFAVLVVLSIRSIHLYPVQYDYSMELYLHYIDVLQGTYVPEKLAYLQEEQQKLEEQMEQTAEEYGDNSDEYLAMKSIQEMLNSLVDLSQEYAVQIEKGIPVEYISRIGYDKLYGSETRRTERQQAILIMTFTILMIGGLFAYERQQGAQVYLRTMPYGRGRMRRRKYGLAAGSVFFICLVVYGCQLYEVCKNYGLTGLSVPVQSVAGFVKLPFRLSVLQFLIALYVVRYLGALSLAYLVLFLSEHSTGILQSLLKALILFVLPAGMVYIGADAVEGVTIFSPLCLMNRLRSVGDMSGSVMIGWILCVLLAVLSIAAGCRWKKGGRHERAKV